MINREQKKIAYRWLMQQGKVARRWINAKVLIIYISGILFIIQAALLANILDAAIMEHHTLTDLLPKILYLLIIMILRAIASWWQEPVGFQAGAQVRTQVRQKFLIKLNQIGPIRLIRENSGGTASFFVEQIEALQNFYADYLPQMVLAVLIPLTILVVIFSVNWLTGLILLVTAPLIPLFMALIGMGVESENQRQFKSLANLSSDFLDKLRGLITLKLFNQSKNQAKAIEKSSEDYRGKTMSVLRVAFLSSAALELFSSVSIAIVAVILGLTLLNKIDIGYYHELTLAKALFILLLAPEFFLPLRQLGVHYHARAEAIAAAAELLTFFSKISTTSKQQDVFQPLKQASNFIIDIRNMAFAYPEKPMLFNGFNLSISPGDKLAVIGPSGSGKSTLINILLGFLKPVAGDICINQQSLKTIDRHQWHQKIAFLGQNSQLLPGTIRDNVLLAKPNASEAEIMSALEKAGALAFINSMPMRLETQIADQHFGLSGGQAQRIALARVFLSDRSILILDEPTASLDKSTEQQIVTAIKTYLTEKTIILISHRVETMGIATRTIRL